MNAADCLKVAETIKRMRQVAVAAGVNLRAQDVEILLLIAAGVDNIRELRAATGLGVNQATDSVRLLSGRPRNKGINRRQSSPFRLVGSRPHPHLPKMTQVFLTQPLFLDD